jgi:hypothetical protein
MIYQHWNTILIRVQSNTFIFGMLFFIFLLNCSSLTFIHSTPTTQTYSCHLRIWLTSISFIGILSLLYLKSNRSSLMNTEIHIYIWKRFIMFFFMQIILLILFSSLQLSSVELILSPEGTHFVERCTQNNGFMIWIIIELSYLFLILLSTLIVIHRSRHLPSPFYESSYIKNCVIMLILFGIIIIISEFLFAETQTKRMMIQGRKRKTKTIMNFYFKAQ